MTLKKTLVLACSHALVLAFGFALGIYLLPIITAPDAPTDAQVQKIAASAQYRGQFVKERTDSDFLHWGEGQVSFTPEQIAFNGRLAPGPDYYVYLADEFVETEAQFKLLKDNMVRVARVNTFNNFIVEVPKGIDLAQYDTVIVWCESFEQFITSARYRGVDGA